MVFQKPMKLVWFSAVHNMFLCVLSLLMFFTGSVGLYQRYSQYGLDEVFCAKDPLIDTGLLPWTMYVYYLSKFPELLDTVILVLKKKPIIFLHWYHHSIVILMVWTWLQYNFVFGAFGLIFNSLIHVLMYYYYFASTLGWNVSYKKVTLYNNSSISPHSRLSSSYLHSFYLLYMYLFTKRNNVTDGRFLFLE